MQCTNPRPGSRQRPVMGETAGAHSRAKVTYAPILVRVRFASGTQLLRLLWQSRNYFGSQTIGLRRSAWCASR